MNQKDEILKKKRHIDMGFEEQPDSEDVADICAYFLRETESYAFVIDFLKRTYGADFDLQRSKMQLRNLAEQRDIDVSIPK
jgi:hypothetical protein